MTPKTKKDIQRYFDGELSPRKARQVFQRLQENGEERKQLAALEKSRFLLQETIQGEVEEANFDGLWLNVQAGISKEQPLKVSERFTLWFARYRLAVAAAATILLMIGVALLFPAIKAPSSSGKDSGGIPLESTQSAVVIESLEVGPEAVSTIFTVPDFEDEAKLTMVIWVTENNAEGGI